MDKESDARMRISSLDEDYTMYRKCVGSFIQRAIEREKFELLIGFERDITYLNNKWLYAADFANHALRKAYLDRKIRLSFSFPTQKGEVGTNSDDSQFDKDYFQYRFEMKPFIDEMVAAERYEVLREFEGDARYIEDKASFQADYGDCSSRSEYIKQKLQRVDTVTLEEDHIAYLNASGFVPGEHYLCYHDYKFEDLPQYQQAWFSLERFAELCPNRIGRLERIARLKTEKKRD